MMSMIADMVEQNEVRTGRRSEGVFFATITFTRKATQGLGVWAASLVLVFANFPEGASPSEVSESSITALAQIYLPAVVVLWLLKVIATNLYRISREEHEDNLAKLSASAE